MGWDFLSFLIVITPFRMSGRAAANNTATNHEGISEDASSGDNSDSPDVTIALKIIVGINHTHNPKINQ